MTVRHVAGAIVLEGAVPVDEAELLLSAMLAAPGAAVDWSACTSLHTAAVQLILAAKVPIKGVCGDPWLRRWAPHIVQQ